MFVPAAIFFLAPRTGACNAFNALLTASRSANGIIPLAIANAPALIKLRAWVNGDKIVLAICDVALGYKIKFWYTLDLKLWLLAMLSSGLKIPSTLPAKAYLSAIGSRIGINSIVPVFLLKYWGWYSSKDL